MISALQKRILRFPTQAFLAIIGALLFFPFLGKVHLFDWGETGFAEGAREMLLTGNYRMMQLDFQPLLQRPPLFIWLQALSMHFFGVNEYAARFPNAICGIATMLVVFNVGRYVFRSQLGTLWALLFACSILPQVYFKSGITDPVFNLFIFLGIYFMYSVTAENDFDDRKTRKRLRRNALLFSALFIGLATLTKGAVAIWVSMLTAATYLFANRGRLRFEITEVIWWLAGITIVITIWLSFSLKANGLAFVMQFFRYQFHLYRSGEMWYGYPDFFHFVILLIGVFPASALIFSSFKRSVHDSQTQNSFKKWMIYLLIIVLVTFTFLHTKVIHYSSLGYFPITFLAAYYLDKLLDGNERWRWPQTIPVLGIAILIVGVFTGGVFIIQSPELFTGYIHDEFSRQCLYAKVYWSDWDIRFGIIYLVAILVAVALMYRRQVRWGTYVLLISSALFINTVTIFIFPRMEKYAQGALIEFLEQKQQEDCIVDAIGLNSYTASFYSNRPAPASSDTAKIHYVVSPITNAGQIQLQNPGLQELYRKNGWVFWKAVSSGR